MMRMAVEARARIAPLTTLVLVTRIAREHGTILNQVYLRRKRYHEGPLG